MKNGIASAVLRVLPFLVLLLVIFIAVKRKRLGRGDLYLQKPNSIVRSIFCWGLFLCYVALTELALYRFGILEVDRWILSAVPSLITIIGIVLLAPAGEELLFRGIFLHKLTRWKINRHLSVLIQALVFVALHSFAYQNTLSSRIGIAQAFVDSVLYAYAMYYTKSIYTPMAMHATGNMIAVVERLILH